eukprot:CAMPEP_0194354798 /NCGR_PEP_ID=MMETSP0174-20130528/2826_1 /TAXON_ID=216777 /ORGANISM="Proboscia alata, Strain PI-D3" /LENGTH=518 /DNA_ID=CAMNT_0039123827 /DNA_START=122 /DNA_END=1678 /DNA_ORIENTATION=+
MKISSPLCVTAFVGTSAAFTFSSVSTRKFGINERTHIAASQSSLGMALTGFLEPDTRDWMYDTKRDDRGSGTIREMERANVFNPEDDLERYIDTPESVAARHNIDGTVLVSGWVNSKERSDQTVFDMLNDEESPFKFSKIIAFVDDEKFAKKRLLSRSARYSGLLDKLDVQGAATPGSLPTAEALEGVTSWVANIEVDSENPGAALQTLKDIAAVATEATCVENVSVLISGASAINDLTAAVDAIKSLDAVQDMAFTVVAVGDIDEKDEGSRPYCVEDFGTAEGVIAVGATFSRAESLRVVTECLALESGIDKALTFKEMTGEEISNSTSSTLIKGLRQAGYTRPQEINHMLVAGVKNFTKTVDAYNKMLNDIENPSEEKVAAAKEAAEAEAKREHIELTARKLKEREDETKEMAMEWAQREYFKNCMSGDVVGTEEQFREIVWDQAMEEADKKFRIMNRIEVEVVELTESEKRTKKIEEASALRARKNLSSNLKVFMDDDDDDGDDDDDLDDDDDDE